MTRADQARAPRITYAVQPCDSDGVRSWDVWKKEDGFPIKVVGNHETRRKARAEAAEYRGEPSKG